MALNYFKGSVANIGEVTRGTGSTGKEWARMNLLLEVAGYQGTTYKIQFNVGTDRIDDVLKFKVGDKVDIACSIYAREWNGKWYNNIDLVNIKPLEGQTTGSAPARVATDAYDVCNNFCKEKNCDYKLGTHKACSNAISMSGYKDEVEDMPEGEEDKMPF